MFYTVPYTDCPTWRPVYLHGALYIQRLIYTNLHNVPYIEPYLKCPIQTARYSALYGNPGVVPYKQLLWTVPCVNALNSAACFNLLTQSPNSMPRLMPSISCLLYNAAHHSALHTAAPPECGMGGGRCVVGLAPASALQLMPVATVGYVDSPADTLYCGGGANGG